MSDSFLFGKNPVENERQLQEADKQNLKRGQDIEMGGAKIILQSPDGSRFGLYVDNDGTLQARAMADIYRGLGGHTAFDTGFDGGFN